MSNTVEAPKADEQLGLLRDMYARTGVLHEAQALQLRMWPLAAFPHIKASEAHLNHDKREIDIILKANSKEKPPKDMEARCEILDKNIKWLLGEDWLVRVKVLNKTVYRGARNAPVKKGSNGDDSEKFGRTSNSRPT